MKRLQELCWNFGFPIVFPRLCAIGILPALVLLGPGSIAWLALWPPWFDKLVLFGSALLFTLSIASNLAISRFLRLTQTELSPYEYKTNWGTTKITDYFRHLQLVLIKPEWECSTVRLIDERASHGTLQGDSLNC